MSDTTETTPLPVVPSVALKVLEAASSDIMPATIDSSLQQTSPVQSIDLKLLEAKVIEVLNSIYDPEIPVNIYELGLIYGIAIDPDKNVKIRMTLTAPACPVAGTLPGEVAKKVESLEEVKSADVELVWEPAWSRERMSESAMLQLGFM